MLLYFTPWRAVTASRLTVYGMLKPEFACACGLAFCRWLHAPTPSSMRRSAAWSAGFMPWA